MAQNFQKYEATIKLTYSSEVFPGDPDDVFELANLERPWVDQAAQLLAEEFEDGFVELLELKPIL
jgi:hypothetical protein